MTAAERVVELCEKKGIRIARLEKECGFANGYVKGLKSGKIPAERVRIIGDYLEVPYSKIDPEIFPEEEAQYYIRQETSRIAQEVFDDPDLRLLFEAAKGAKPENIRLAAEMLRQFKRTNPDG